MRRATILLSLAVALSACGGGGNTHGLPAASPAQQLASAGPPSLPAIAEVTSTNGVAAMTLHAALDDSGRPAMYYNGQDVAPTIRVSPGDTIHIHYENALPLTCGLGLETDSNLHFHGLASAPQTPGDEVIGTKAVPGGSFDYTVTINPDQPPGLYWYHVHAHDLTNWQVGNGMAGAIVVEGIANEVPAVAGLRERVIVLRDIPNDPTLQSSARRIAARRRPRDADGSGGPTCGPEPGAQTTINGMPLATIGIRPGERQLFRVLNASGHRHFDLAVDGQQLQLVAQDGVPVHTYPGAPSSITVPDIVIPPAGRAEFVVTGGASPASLVSKCFNSGPAGDADPLTVFALLADDFGTQPTAHVRAPKTVRHTSFFRQAPPPPSQTREIHFEEDANGFYLDNAAYDPAAAPNFVAQSGTTEEWNLVNDTDEVHVFHIHQAHFIVEDINGTPNTIPHWVDNVDVPPQGHGVRGEVHPGTMHVLIDFRDPTIRGTFLYHCHILDHEDKGMMAKITVQ